MLRKTQSGDLEELIKERIKREGKITFATFMEMALYTPSVGYYTSGIERVGAQGDFYTSPSTHPAFGALIALQLEEMWGVLGRPQPFTVVEMGAGKGLLRQDVLGYLPHLSAFTNSLDYQTLEREGASLSRLPLGVTGCFLSNELVDAFPTHRVTCQGGELKEIYVDLEDDSLVEVVDKPSSVEIKEYLRRVNVKLEEGWQVEVNLEATRWIAGVAQALAKGFILTIDYGYPAHQLYSTQRRQGTLLCYHRHMANSDFYRRIGHQDITAHVDFTSLVVTGQEHGVCCLGFVSQRRFLTNLGLISMMKELAYMGLKQKEYDANHFAMGELLRPEGMGNFGVLIQAKELEDPRLTGLNSSAVKRESDHLPVPLLTIDHISLLKAKYPQHFWEEDDFNSSTQGRA